jgi:hypothetical protein
MLKKALKGTAKFLLWLVHGIHYQEFIDPETGTTYYGVANKKEF